VIEAIVAALFRAIADAVPGVLAEATGKKNDDEAVNHLNELVKKMPRRTGAGGTWDADLAARKHKTT
jgi:hypothetical protein